MSSLYAAGSYSEIADVELTISATNLDLTPLRFCRGSAERLPFADYSFDKVLTINSMQIWPDAIEGLREMRRVMKPSARITVGFTRYSGQPKSGLIEAVVAAGFAHAQVTETEEGFCAIATKP